MANEVAMFGLPLDVSGSDPQEMRTAAAIMIAAAESALWIGRHGDSITLAEDDALPPMRARTSRTRCRARCAERSSQARCSWISVSLM